LEAARDEVLARWGRIDILVHAAGAMCRPRRWQRGSRFSSWGSMVSARSST
jgi:NADP-dependent 3-hydroxy acid dehydrogenase YdfG